MHTTLSPLTSAVAEIHGPRHARLSSMGIEEVTEGWFVADCPSCGGLGYDGGDFVCSSCAGIGTLEDSSVEELLALMDLL